MKLGIIGSGMIVYDLLTFIDIIDEIELTAILGRKESQEKIETLGITGKSSIVFVIGGSLGLHETAKKRSDFALSFSKMTFPHQLMRVILVEQIYRGFRIINGEPYHK